MKSLIKLYLFVILLTLFFAIPAFGEKNEVCDEAVQVVMGEYWNGIKSIKHIDNAIEHCTEVATNNDADTQIILSMMFLLKNDNKEDEQSYFWTLKAANNNHVEAQFHLGQMYEKGHFVEAEPSLAINWYEKSANNGWVIAQRKLGEIYLLGIITEVDVGKSIYWYEKAAAQCDKLAISKLMEIYSKKTERVPGNPQKVEYWKKRYIACNDYK